ncbi:hypothetical protein I308_100124 [Cryptococcus tetragattii IND107]|uniref:Uncharacterized protein n=1 Tax=Cryptococcus tetragattii IND107 TaxID=1296105 RepID=A0ABR3C3W8_9TREE
MFADQQPPGQPIHQAITELAQYWNKNHGFWPLEATKLSRKSLPAAKAIFDRGTFITILMCYQRLGASVRHKLELKAQVVIVNAVKSIDDSNGDAEKDFEGNQGSDDSDEDTILEDF